MSINVQKSGKNISTVERLIMYYFELLFRQIIKCESLYVPIIEGNVQQRQFLLITIIIIKYFYYIFKNGLSVPTFKK